MNGCDFCNDLAQAQAIQKAIGTEKFRTLDDYQISPQFSEAERAALSYVEEINLDSQVNHATFDELQKHFNETEIIEITWLNVIENYFNLLTLPLGIETNNLRPLVERHLNSL
ncbi:MAG: hypothetical protein GWN00_16315 [Aliifodinibius sp.]|nr:carboxymuconolactone decarboxylase family protein [Fodinibius sp.]NIV12606.1 hypothetical protein [Fodinibius sp.]NIY26312.1 hypothetical protein [Fodinibius sp.]